MSRLYARLDQPRDYVSLGERITIVLGALILAVVLSLLFVAVRSYF